MKYSVFFHHILCAAKEMNCSVDKLLDTVRSWGISHVELDRDEIGAEEHQIRTRAALLRAHGLLPSSIYGFYDWARGDLPGKDDLLLRQAALLDCPRVMIIPGFFTDSKDGALCRHEQARMISGMQRFAALAGPQNVTVTIECFDDERSPISTIAGIDAFLQSVPELMLTLETGNFRFSGEDVIEAHRRFSQRIRHVHLKDRFLPTLAPEQAPTGEPKQAATGEMLYPCAVGHGHMPVAQVLDALAGQGYDGVLTIEHFGVPSYAEAIRASLSWLKAREGKE